MIFIHDRVIKTFAQLQYGYINYKPRSGSYSLIRARDSEGLNQVLQSLPLDETIEKIMGGFGWSQFIQSILVSVPLFFDAQQTFISFYADAVALHHL
jgi:hypothetical protein